MRARGARPMRQGLILVSVGCSVTALLVLFAAQRKDPPIASSIQAAEQDLRGSPSPAIAKPPMRTEVETVQPPSNSAPTLARDKEGSAVPPEPPTSPDPMTYLRQTIRGLPQYLTDTPKFELSARMVAGDDRLNPRAKKISAEDAKRLDEELASWNAMIADVADQEWKKRGEAYMVALARGDMIRTVDTLKLDATTAQGRSEFALKSARQVHVRDLKARYNGDLVYMVIAGPPTPEDQYAKYTVYLHRGSAPEVFTLKDAGDKLRLQRAQMVRDYLARLE